MGGDRRADAVLGVDVGTTAVKAAVVGAEGDVRGNVWYRGPHSAADGHEPTVTAIA